MAEPTAARERKIVYSIQVLRGLAAFAVLLRHASKAAVGAGGHEAFGVGQAGVDVFFVISGVVIYLTSRHLSWDVFLRRRIARIVPLYWLVLLSAVASMLLPFGAFRTYGGFDPANTVLSFLFVPWRGGEGGIFPPIVAGWTLNFEMYFYAICTLVLAVAPRRLFLPLVSAVVVVGILLGIPLVWAGGEDVTFGPFILLLPISIEFVAGLWIAHLWSQGRRTSTSVNLALVVGAIVWFALTPIAHPYTVWRPLAWGVPAAAVVWAAMASEERVPFGRWRAGLMLGDSSYALYLTHTIVLAVGVVLLRKAHLVGLPIAVKLAAFSAVCLLAGVAVHLLIELPLVRAASRALGLTSKPADQVGLRSAELAPPDGRG